MSQFRKQIPFGRFALDFFFNRIYTVEGVKYHVSVANNSILHYFMMEKKNEKFVLSNITKVPDWVIQLESYLGEAILEHINSGEKNSN